MTKIWEHLVTHAYVQVKKDDCQVKKKPSSISFKQSVKRLLLILWLNKEKKSCL